MRHANRWDLPKGHCDGDETFLQTAIREMEEETGIAPEMVTWDPDFQFDLRYQVNYRRHGNQVFEKHVRYFLGQVPKKMDVKVTEHESFKWLPWDPPHQIQAETIDPLLAAIDGHWDQ
jgi:8-oxo-dGTP pyrophosphatase MutT (NUDIX family)